MNPCTIVLPSGSLSERLRMYLAKAGYDIDKPNRRGICGGSCNGKAVFIERDRRMVARHVAGKYDAGITGLDLLINSGLQHVLRTVADLCFSRKTDQPARWVAVTSPASQCTGTVRIGCELPGVDEYVKPSILASLQGKQNAEVLPVHVQLEGNEEMAIEEDFCDVVLVVTETGITLRETGLFPLSGCESLLVSVTQIIAKPKLPPEKEEALQEIRFALGAVIGAATRVMMKADLPTEKVHGLQLPAEVSPTVASLDVEGWSAVEICIPRSDIGAIGLKLERACARAIVVQDVIAFCGGKSNMQQRKEQTSAPYSGIPLTDTKGYHH